MAELIGTLVVPPVGKVVEGFIYDAPDIPKTGTFVVPNEEDVKIGVKYGDPAVGP